jgi:hypothetical protein
VRLRIRTPLRPPLRTPIRVPVRPQLRDLYRPPLRSFTVRVPVPVSLITRTVRLQQPSLKISTRLNRKISLPSVRRSQHVMRKIKVLAPIAPHIRLPATRWTASAKRSTVTIHSKISTKKLLVHEYNRVRNQERKSQKIKHRHGQMESLNRDRSGMVSAAIQRGLSPQIIADTAMVSRALYGD